MLSHKSLKKAYDEAHTRAAVNWKAFLGDTFPEKYQPFYGKLVEITHVLIAKGNKGYFWIVCDPIIGSLLESKVASGESMFVEILPMGTDVVYSLGVLTKRWRVYVDTQFEPGQILIGSTSENVEPHELNPAKCAVINILNIID